VRDVRERLLRDGIHADAAVLEVVRAAAAEAGFNEQQTAVLVQAFQRQQQSGNEEGGKTAGRVGRTVETFKALADEVNRQP
jgi:ATP phosphoribosyltransferase regulatory subunit HisZ